MIDQTEFLDNSGTRGIIDVTLAPGSQGYAVISSNQFVSNAGMLTGGSNVLRLARQEDELTSSRAKCGGYTLISNHFTGNVGCFKS